jgi:hypothetical protein
MQDVFDEHDKPPMPADDAPANTLAGSGMLSIDQLFPSHHSAKGPLAPVSPPRSHRPTAMQPPSGTHETVSSHAAGAPLGTSGNARRDHLTPSQRSARGIALGMTFVAET